MTPIDLYFLSKPEVEKKKYSRGNVLRNFNMVCILSDVNKIDPNLTFRSSRTPSVCQYKHQSLVFFFFWQPKPGDFFWSNWPKDILLNQCKQDWITIHNLVTNPDFVGKEQCNEHGKCTLQHSIVLIAISFKCFCLTDTSTYSAKTGCHGIWRCTFLPQLI